MEALVVGAGPMGRWAGRVLRDGVDATLAFLDRDTQTAREAAATVGGRTVDPATVVGDSAEQFGVVCVAVPIPAAASVIGRYGPRARTAVVDVTGTMAGPVAAMEGLTGRERASLHPLFAPDSEPGNVPVVVTERGPTVERVLETLGRRGNRVVETTPAEHDRVMGTVQARAHAAVLAFGLAAESVPEGFHTPVSAELVSLVERVTGGEPGVYRDIQTAFDGRQDVAEAAQRLAAVTGDGFDSLYREAGAPHHDTGADADRDGGGER